MKAKSSKPNRPQNQEKFIDFLKDNNALIPFCSNLAHSNLGLRGDYTPIKEKRNSNLTLFTFLTQNPKHQYWMANAFDWAHTTEGWDFWVLIDDEWEAICNSL